MPDISKALSLLNSIAQSKSTTQLREIIVSISDSHSAILEKYTKSLEQIAALKKQVEKYNTWAQEKENYESHQTSRGATLYRKKKTKELFCPNCYETRMVAVHLQPSPLREHLHRFFYKFCPNCKNTFII